MGSRIYFCLAILGLVFGIIQPPITSAEELNLQDSLKQAFTLFRAGKLKEAEEPLNRLLAATNNPNIPHNEILFYRGYLRAMNCRFDDAADDMKDVLDAAPSEHEVWFLLTPLLIQNGEMDEYKDNCQGMLRRFGNTTNAQIAERTAKCCLLMPSAVSSVDLAEAAKVAEKCVEFGKKGEVRPWRLMTRGLSEYRLGHFERAIETMKLAQKDAIQAHFGWIEPCQADAYFVSAMAHQQLKQTEEASKDFKRGRIIVVTKLPALDSGNLGQSWVDVLMTRILMQETEKVVQAVTPEQK